jgi:hypothetical protein
MRREARCRIGEGNKAVEVYGLLDTVNVSVSFGSSSF